MWKKSFQKLLTLSSRNFQFSNPSFSPQLPFLHSLDNPLDSHRPLFSSSSFSTSFFPFNEQESEVDEENNNNEHYVFKPRRVKSNRAKIFLYGQLSAIILASFIVYKLMRNFRKTKTLKKRVRRVIKKMDDPISLKQLPDREVREGFPELPVLVINVFDVLLHREYRPSTGVRYRKRKNMEQFLENMSKYYEVVLYCSDEMFRSAAGVLLAVDPQNRYRKLFLDHTRRGKKKDLTLLNREIESIVLIDSKHNCPQLQPENSIILPQWKGEDENTFKEMEPLLLFLASRKILNKIDMRKELKIIKKDLLNDEDDNIEQLLQSYQERMEFIKSRTIAKTKKRMTKRNGII